MQLRAFTAMATRLAGVGGKFVVTMVLARTAGVQAVGEFALFFGAVNVMVFVVGLDFHLFSIRELLLRQTKAGRVRVMVAQLSIDGALYALFAALAVIVAVTGVGKSLPFPIGWLLAITIGDHMATQLSRAFMMLRHPQLSNVIYAVKSGLWGWVGCAAVFAGLMPAAIQPFYVLWFVFDLAAIAIGLVAMYFAMRGAGLSRPKKMTGWFRRGIRTSRYFYATSVATMLIASLDRFIIAGSISVADAGIFSFWQVIVGLLPIIAYAVAAMHFLPILVESYKRGRIAEFNEAAAGFLKKTVSVCAACGAVVLALSPWIANLVGKPEMAVHWSFVLLLLFGAAGNALWQVPYQVLFSAGEDRFLAVTLILITAGWAIADLLIIPLIGLMGAAVVVAVTNLFIYYVLQRAAARHLACVATSRVLERGPATPA
jgi:O-antigen/teichoic acid export membrane protein